MRTLRSPEHRLSAGEHDEVVAVHKDRQHLPRPGGAVRGEPDGERQARARVLPDTAMMGAEEGHLPRDEPAQAHAVFSFGIAGEHLLGSHGHVDIGPGRRLTRQRQAAGGALHLDLPRLGAHDTPREQVALAHEAGGEKRLRLEVDPPRRAHVLDAALVHDRDDVGDAHGLLLVVGDVDKGGADLFLDVEELRLHLAPEVDVERAERLVQQQDLGLHHQGARQGDALALPAGELVDVAVPHPAEPHHLEGRGHARGALRSGAPCACAGRTRRFPPPTCAGTGRSPGTRRWWGDWPAACRSRRRRR